MEKHELAEERRAQIRRAALTCMSRKGYARTTMDDIARECGLSRGAIYWYYPSKREVFLALVQEGLGRMSEALGRSASDRYASAAERLAHMLDVAGRLFQEEGDVGLVTRDFWSLSRHDAEFERIFRQAYVGFLARVEGVVAEGISKGEFRPVDATEVARILLGMYDGLFFHAALGLPVDWAKVAGTLNELLEHGLAQGEGG